MAERTDVPALRQEIVSVSTPDINAPRGHVVMKSWDTDDGEHKHFYAAARGQVRRTWRAADIDLRTALDALGYPDPDEVTAERDKLRESVEFLTEEIKRSMLREQAVAAEHRDALFLREQLNREQVVNAWQGRLLLWVLIAANLWMIAKCGP